MPLTFDLAVIGTGAGASMAANNCAQAGWRVAVVDQRPYGGTCALRGCDPKKVLVGVAYACDQASRLQGYGLADPPSLTWANLMAFKRTFTDPVPERKEESFRGRGIETLHGTARLLDGHTMRIGENLLRAERILIAAGARPAPLPFDGADLLATSDDFLELDDLPRRIAFVGGGYISMEFAFLALTAGAQVSLVHRGEHVLKGFERDLADRLVEHARRRGMAVHLRTAVTGVESRDAGLVVHGETNGGERVRVVADLVVHGAGRVPNLDSLDLATANVARTDRGVSVNEFLQSTTAPHVYAAGDCADSGGPQLTPVGGRESETAAENLLHGNRRKVDNTAVPTVAFTDPPLASVGLTELAAREAGLDVEIKEGDMSQWFESRRLREQTAAFKVLLERGTDRVVGAHVLGAGSQEMINLFALAMREGLDAGALRRMVYAYPTLASTMPYLL